MAKRLTLILDEDLLRAARNVALDRNTSLNQLVCDFLKGLVLESDPQAAASAATDEIFSHQANSGRKANLEPGKPS